MDCTRVHADATSKRVIEAVACYRQRSHTPRGSERLRATGQDEPHRLVAAFRLVRTGKGWACSHVQLIGPVPKPPAQAEAAAA